MSACLSARLCCGTRVQDNPLWNMLTCTMRETPLLWVIPHRSRNYDRRSGYGTSSGHRVPSIEVLPDEFESATNETPLAVHLRFLC